MNEVKIVRIEAIEGTKVEKEGKSYSVPVNYVLIDGSEVSGIYSRRLQRDVKAFVTTLPKEVSNMEACFNDDGEFWGTRTTMSIG